MNRGLSKRLRKTLYLHYVEKNNYLHAKCLFANTTYELEQIRSHKINNSICIVPNGISVEDKSVKGQKGSLAKFQYQMKPSTKFIVFIGRIVPKKGIHLLIQAFVEIRKLYPELILIIGGDRSQSPEYINQLDAIINNQKIEDAIIWTGFLDEQAKSEILASATIFSHVSESEGMAMSILEAMAAGVPTVVSTRCYMSQAAEAGAVLECNYDVLSLKESIVKLLNNNSLQREIGTRAVEYVKKYHSWESIAKQTITAYCKYTNR
jgi:glycosyltransferase involved in cell wall biosynthesis